MQLTVLGCRSGMPADGQASSGYLLETGTSRLLLDCGPGIATALSGLMDPARLDGVVISHMHLDHCYDLLPVGKAMLAASLTYPSGEESPQPAEAPGPVRPVPLYVPEGAGDLLDRLAALFPVVTLPLLDRAFELAFDVREYAPGTAVTLGDCAVSLHGLRHALPNCGIRVESGSATFAYTGDTGVTDALVDLAGDADLLLAEATLDSTDYGPHGHLSPADAGAVAKAAEVGCLVLTHFVSADPVRLEAMRAEAATVFDGPVHVAVPAARFAVTPRSRR